MAGTIVAVDQSFWRLIRPDAAVIKLAGGFEFTEGPVWEQRTGSLIFSDLTATQFIAGLKAAAWKSSGGPAPTQTETPSTGRGGS